MFHYDFKELVKNKEKMKKNCVDRGLLLSENSGNNGNGNGNGMMQDVNAVDEVIELYEKQKSLMSNLNKAVFEQRKYETLPRTQEKLEQAMLLKNQQKSISVELDDVEKLLKRKVALLPNWSHPDSPIGDESQNKVLSIYNPNENNNNNNSNNFKPKPHYEVASSSLIDFETGAKVCGSKFYYTKNAGAFLEMALTNWVLHHVTNVGGYIPYITPDLASEAVVEACGFQPRGESSQIYRIQDSNLCLIGTAEITLAGIHADSILSMDKLPLRLAGVSHCFRREIGSTGLQSKGIYRVHQFTKVELFVLSTPEESENEFNRIIEIQKDLLQNQLNLPYRVLDMATKELSHPAYRKYDMEVWMPSRNNYGEVSSTSNCTDYQSRRLDIRFRRNTNSKPEYLHTLNGTALAVPRILLAILENNQQPDGSVLIPKVLHPFLNGKTTISPTGHLI